MEEIDRKLEVVLERTAKLDNLESLLTQLNSRLSTVEDRLNIEVANLVKRVVDVEASQDFLGKQYEAVKKANERMIKTTANLEAENVKLNKNCHSLKNELEQEKYARSRDSQYLRSSFNVKLCGIPIQEGEDDPSKPNNPVTLGLIDKVAEASGMERFSTQQIDVCHRVGNKLFSPIIMRFKTKHDRLCFYKQKKNLNELTADDIGIKLTDEQQNDMKKSDTGNRGGGRGRGRGGGASGAERQTSSSIYMQESLTQLNAELLKEAKVAASALQYEFPGYVTNGEVRVKLNKSAKFIAITCKDDINKIS